MTHDPIQQTRQIVERLREQGHPTQADQLARPLAEHGEPPVQGVEHGLLFALREVCETVLTAVEAIDPVTQTMIEQLRLGVEKRLGMPLDHSGAPADEPGPR